MKKEEKIVMKDDVKTHSWTLRKELLGFEVGMSYYSGFEKDEEDIVIPFSLSLYITSRKIVEQLTETDICSSLTPLSSSLTLVASKHTTVFRPEQADK